MSEAVTGIMGAPLREWLPNDYGATCVGLEITQIIVAPDGPDRVLTILKNGAEHMRFRLGAAAASQLAKLLAADPTVLPAATEAP